MPPRKIAIKRALIAGVILSVISCFFPIDDCMCGPMRGLPLPLIYHHNDLFCEIYIPLATMASHYFNYLFALIDLVFWGAIVYPLIRLFHRLSLKFRPQ